MKIDDEKIVALRDRVAIAAKEFDQVIQFHEVWRPAAFDKDLHSRLGVSYGSQAFIIIRAALRLEVILTLNRIWDDDSKTIGMPSILSAISDCRVIEALASDRASRIMPGADMLSDFISLADKAKVLVDSYYTDGSKKDTREKLKKFRDERLAHYDRREKAKAEMNIYDNDVEEFYMDTSNLISVLLHLVEGHAYEPKETMGVFQFYAERFWKRIGPEER